ncbi:MAG: CoA transferase subunit A [Elusimicrobia bacterium]|nr:CoA transferase subunit A [Elusimicrobiota bacterium]
MTEKHHCPDCRWLETRVDLDDGLNYSCQKGNLKAGAPVLTRTPCRDFSLDETAVSVDRKASRSGRTPAHGTRANPPYSPFLKAADTDGFRAFNRDEKELRPVPKIMGEHEAVKRFIKDGDYIGFELYGTVRCPLSIVREVVRQGRKRLRLLGQGLIDVDLLVASGCISALDLAYVGYEAYGLSPVLRRAVEKGKLKAREWSNGALAWRLKAAGMGLPFLPTRSMLGSDTLKSSGVRTMRDPYTGIQVALLPALQLDCAVIHVHRADVNGNCQIDGITGFAPDIARAAKRLIVTAEEIVDEAVIRRTPERTIIPFYLVDAVVHAPFGAHPGETCGLYRRDEEHIKAYLKAIATEEGTRAFLDEWVNGLPDHMAYRRKVGLDRLEGLRHARP